VTDPHSGIPAAEMHIFPAEINACYYENEIPAIMSKNYRTLNAEIVALLEDRERFELFLKAYALGFIHIVEDEGGKSFWAYKLLKDKEAIYLTNPSATSENQIKDDVFQVIHNFVMEGVDQRPGMGQVRFVDWEKLREATYAAPRGLGKEKVIKLYRGQITDPKGLIQRIRADVEVRRSQISDEILRKTVGQEYDDLADVATVVYLKTIQAMEH